MWVKSNGLGNCGAFTLVEVLVVIGIIGVLSSLLMATVAKQKEKSTQIVCINNLRQMVMTAQLHATDNSDRLPWSNWLAGDAPDREGWLYTKKANATGTNQFDVTTGVFWQTFQNRRLYRCPRDKESHREFENRGQQISSYVMNGAVNGYHKVTYPPATLADFRESDIMFWETDENEPRFFNDGASRPDEGVSPRHNQGAIIASFGGQAFFIKFDDWYAEVASTNRSRVWCSPSEADGRGDIGFLY